MSLSGFSASLYHLTSRVLSQALPHPDAYARNPFAGGYWPCECNPAQVRDAVANPPPTTHDITERSRKDKWTRMKWTTISMQLTWREKIQTLRVIHVHTRPTLIVCNTPVIHSRDSPVIHNTIQIGHCVAERTKACIPYRVLPRMWPFATSKYGMYPTGTSHITWEYFLGLASPIHLATRRVAFVHSGVGVSCKPRGCHELSLGNHLTPESGRAWTETSV